MILLNINNQAGLNISVLTCPTEQKYRENQECHLFIFAQQSRDKFEKHSYF